MVSIAANAARFMGGYVLAYIGYYYANAAMWAVLRPHILSGLTFGQAFREVVGPGTPWLRVTIVAAVLVLIVYAAVTFAARRLPLVARAAEAVAISAVLTSAFIQVVFA